MINKSVILSESNFMGCPTLEELLSKFIREPATQKTLEAIRHTVNNFLMKNLIYCFEPKFEIITEDRNVKKMFL